MPIVQPAQPRATITDTSGGLVVTIPVKRNWFVLFFLPVWLVGWAFGEVAVSAEILSGKGEPEVNFFLIAWLTFWTFGGIVAVLALLWNLAGRERVTLGPSLLSIRRELFGRGRERQYELRSCSNLRVSPASYNPFDFRSGMQFWGYGGGPIAFDHGASTIRFGSGLEEAEASSVANTLKSRQPFEASAA